MQSRDDPLIRDKKKPSYPGWEALPYFVGATFVAFPIWLTTLLPFTLVWQLISSFIKKPKPQNSFSDNNIASPSSLPTKRKYDLILYGATGFTGKLAANYLAKNYNDKLSWAIAGRNEKSLLEVRQSFPDKAKNVPFIIVDSSRPESIVSLVEQTKVVITTVGPFARYGDILVEACAKYGTHYCDITGEVDWARTTIERFDSVARKTGAKIVHFCGFDCIPPDLTVFALAKHLKDNYNEELVSAELDYLTISSPSGGTIETIYHSLDNRNTKSKLGYDPLLKDLDNQKSVYSVQDANQKIISYSNEAKSWVGPSIMASAMICCIKRSNVINHYSQKLRYKEAMVHTGFMAAAVQLILLIVFATTFFFPPFLKNMIRKLLPSPGQGPSKEDMENGFLKLTAVGRGSKGTRVESMMYFPVDAGYLDTARMLVESGLTLVLDEDKLKGPGGVFTPASCQGDVLLQRLIKTGTTFYVK